MVVPIRDKLSLKAHFKKLLNDTATKAERGKRNEWVTIAGENNPGWVFHERETMWQEVNRQRSARGFPPVTLLDIKRVEQLAVGHVDYDSKFALYCAELSLGERDIRP